MADSATQVRVQLTTRHPDIAIAQSPGELLVSTSLRRYALSTLVNDLLETSRPIPFEFLINGQFLRSSIDDFLTANGISAETTLTVEYVRALVPPLHIASFEHDDWVSDVDVLSGHSLAAQWSKQSVAEGQERILSACYDGLLRVWDPSTSEVVATSPAAGGHTSYVTSAKFLSPTSVVSAGADRTLRIWTYGEGDTDSLNSSSSITPTLELYGHKASVDSIAVHAPSSRILSASADNTVGVWSTTSANAPAAPVNLLASASAHANKRRKLAAKESKQAPGKPAAQRGPLQLLTGHAAPVSAAIFAPTDPTVAYSTSWDHTLRTWDLPTALTLRGHSNAVVALAPRPGDAYGLVSGSHDGTCRIWDVRSVNAGVETGGDAGGGQVGEPVYRITRESVDGDSERKAGGDGVKVFGVAWDKNVGIVSGGEDKRVQVNRGEEVVGGRE
ncbi:ribosome biogenesis protein ytm1 [Neofusicoccum ribis]|uniref:Ribosome biogenesis protein YTM1 n=1 Tax=Neofusicoccum ribis TaxID=45134 RepID=A0ABR3SHJ9_9PEZI